MRPPALLLALAAALGGCLGASPDADHALSGDGTAGGAPALDAPVELVAATLAWHEGSVIEPYHVATQPVAHPCVYEGDDGEAEPYFNNLHVSGRTPVGAMPPGTRALEVALDWTDADYLGDTLVLAYREGDAWRTTDPLPKGTSVVDVRDVKRTTRADLWLCVAGDDEGFRPRLFAGDVSIAVRALGDT